MSIRTGKSRKTADGSRYFYGVSMTRAQAAAIEAFAERNKWSTAGAIRECVFRTLGISAGDIINRPGRLHD
jgi:hypothetical protein